MTDVRLRQLERRFKESGSTDDEVAWLKERVRVGDLDRERLLLACSLSSPAAIAAMGSKAPPPATSSEVFVLGLNPEGRMALARVGIAVSRRVLSLWESPCDSPRSAIEAFENWLVIRVGRAQLEERLAEARVAVQQAERSYLQVFERPGVEALVAGAAGSALDVYDDSSDPVSKCEDACKRALLALESSGDCSDCLAADQALLDAIREELLIWALGYGDPVRERAEARQLGL